MHIPGLRNVHILVKSPEASFQISEVSNPVCISAVLKSVSDEKLMILFSLSSLSLSGPVDQMVQDFLFVRR